MKFTDIHWKLAFGLLVAFALTTGSVFAQDGLAVEELGEVEPPAVEQNQDVKDAAALFQKRDVAGAIELLKKAAAANPDMQPAQVIIASWFAQVKQGAAVRASLERAIIEVPADPEAFIILADIDLQQRQVTEADLLYTKASGLLASFTKSQKRKDALQRRVYLGQARVAQARGDWATAQKQLEDLLTVTPDEGKPTIMKGLASVLFKQDDITGARNQLEAAWTADPESVHWGAVMAALYDQSNDTENAKTWMKFAIDSKPQDLRLRLAAAERSLRRGDLVEAKAQADEALKLDSQSLPAMILRGAVALFQKDYVTAEADFQKAHLAAPANFAASNNLALALCEQDDDAKKQRAAQYAQENYRLNDKSAEAASTLGWVLYKMGDLRQAEMALRQAASLSQGNVSQDTRYYIAQVYADAAKLAESQGKDAQAIKIKDQAKQLVQSALAGTRPFSQRPEAEALAKELGL